MIVGPHVCSTAAWKPYLFGVPVFRLIPINNPNIDWPVYLTCTKEILGRSVTQKFDDSWVQLDKTVSNYLSTLREMECPGTDMRSFPGALMDHVFYSFLVIATNELATRIISTSRLTCSLFNDLPREDFSLLLISGTLTQFRSCVVNCCVDGMPLELREFGTAILVHFKSIEQFSIGLTEFPRQDKTIKVIEGR